MEPYERTAEAYDLIQAARGHSYPDDADRLTTLARQRCPSAASLLDVACGTGLHLMRFAECFDHVAGLDSSAGMLARAASRLPDVGLRLGDMRDFEFGETFDVVTCLFSAIGSMQTLDDLESAIATMARHLNAGGVLIVEPWLRPEDWVVPHLTAEAAKGDGIAVARASTNGRRGHISTFRLHWTIVTPESEDYVVEDYELGLYEFADYEDAFRRAGLSVERLDGGPHARSLFVGVKL